MEPSSRGALLIVGAGPRLGAAIARSITAESPARSRAGSRSVGLIGRNAARTAELSASLRAEGIDAYADAADVADAKSMTAAIDRLAALTGPFAVAVHNVSVWREGGVGSLTADQLLTDLAAGAASLVTLANAVVPGMTSSEGGTIIATGSGAADSPTAGAPSLAVQKAALRILTRAFAAELAPSGVHVATVTVRGELNSPGYSVTDIAAVYRELVDETAGPQDRWRTVVEFTGTGGSSAGGD